MDYLKAFGAGAIAVVMFHQGMLAILQAVGLTDRGPFSMQPTAPLGVPQVLSLTFWGGVWGVILFVALRNVSKPLTWWILTLIVGTLATTLVAWFVVSPIKGQPIAGGGKPAAIATALLVNGAWALGTTLLLWLFRVPPRIR